MSGRRGILILFLAVILVGGCDTSPKPTVTPQPEVTQPTDKDNAKTKDKESKSTSTDRSSENDKLVKAVTDTGSSGKQKAGNDTPAKAAHGK
jgi:hypothetical protein